MSQGDVSFSHALCRKACLQVIYAQAERRASAASQSQQQSQGTNNNANNNNKQKPPTPATSVFVVDKVTDALVDVITSFISQVAKTSSKKARHSGRTNVTFYDVLNTLNIMSVSTQSTIRDIAYYCSLQRVEFPLTIPSFPILKPPPPRVSQNTAKLLNVPTDDVYAKRKRPYIENWMPDIPNAYTFVSNPGIITNSTNVLIPPQQQSKSLHASLARLRDNTAMSMSQHATSNNDNIPNNIPNSQMENNSTTNNSTINPFMALPIIVNNNNNNNSNNNNNNNNKIPNDDDDVREPLEIEINNIQSNGDVIETKYSISDQKRARVDRILQESGTIMLSSTAGNNNNNTSISIASNNPPSTLTPSTPTGGGGGLQSKT